MNPASPCGGQGLAIVRFQSRSGRWMSWPEARAERDWRHRSNIKSQVHRQEHEHWEYVHKHFHCCISCIWCLYSCSTVGMHANSMQKVSGSKSVCIFLNPDQNRYELVCTGMYQYEPICTGTWKYIKVQGFGTWKYIKVQGFVPPCTVLFRCTGLLGTSLYCLVL